ncbi:MAG: hypothetical protein PUK59_05520 [Actinomycetaceae bacterium]|nr:hypothetical protein [Actinomycetaceae bacterium]MDY5854686.1 hypothetical protein [Arcanobacterium sp.]
MAKKSFRLDFLVGQFVLLRGELFVVGMGKIGLLGALARKIQLAEQIQLAVQPAEKLPELVSTAGIARWHRPLI